MSLEILLFQALLKRIFMHLSQWKIFSSLVYYKLSWDINRDLQTIKTHWVHHFARVGKYPASTIFFRSISCR